MPTARWQFLFLKHTDIMPGYFSVSKFYSRYFTSPQGNPRDKVADDQKRIQSTRSFVLDRDDARSAAKIILREDTDIHGKTIDRFSTTVISAKHVCTSGSLGEQTLFDPRVMKNLVVMELDFSGATLPRKLVEALENAIKTNPALEKVVLKVGWPKYSSHAFDINFQINPDIAVVFDALKGAIHLRDLEIEMRGTDRYLEEHSKVFGSLAGLIKFLPNLENLNLDLGQNKLTDEDLRRIVHNMSRIKLKALNLDIGRSVDLKQSGVGDFLKELSKLATLQSLKLNIAGNEGKFEKDGLMTVLKKLPELRKLSLDVYSTFDRDIVTAIANEVSEFNARPPRTPPLRLLA